MSSDVVHLTRSINRVAERELWARAAGRCEFSGCNRLLYRSGVTQERVNVSEKAHIYSFSREGPRGHGPHAVDNSRLNDIENLLLVCHDCHKKIDSHPERYPAELLRRWKEQHEDRVELVTGIHPTKQSQVVLYGAAIGDVAAQLSPRDAMEAMFPDWYPATERPVSLAMHWEGKDTEPSYWQTEEENLTRSYERHLRPLLTGNIHISIFGLAPMPLLAKLGALLTDQIPAEVYQRHREPQTWRWLPGSTDVPYEVVQADDTNHTPALIIALSDRIARDRITSVLGPDVSLWELTISEPGNDFLRSPDQLGRYRRTLRQLLDQIGATHGKHVPVHIFPAMPVACAVDLGRIRMPKVDSPWILYDHNRVKGRFVPALTLGGPQ